VDGAPRRGAQDCGVVVDLGPVTTQFDCLNKSHGAFETVESRYGLCGDGFVVVIYDTGKEQKVRERCDLIG
jgi:hypothetical protein